MRQLSICAALCLMLAACGGTEYRAQGLAVAPDADLEVTIDDTTMVGNFPMSVEIDRLRPAWEIDPGLTRFAVWSIPTGTREPLLLGYLEYDRDARSGRLETVTPYDQLTVFVTAENDETPVRPSNTVVAIRTVDPTEAAG